MGLICMSVSTSHVYGLGIDSVVFIVRANELDEYRLLVIENRHYETVVVACDVEDNPTRLEHTCRTVKALDV